MAKHLNLNVVSGYEITRGLIVFDDIADEWVKKEIGSWGQLKRHLDEFSEHMEVGAVQLCSDNAVRLLAEYE